MNEECVFARIEWVTYHTRPELIPYKPLTEPPMTFCFEPWHLYTAVAVLWFVLSVLTTRYIYRNATFFADGEKQCTAFVVLFGWPLVWVGVALGWLMSVGQEKR